MTTRDVIEYARRHGGVITTREAIDLGMARATLTRRVNDGVFVRLRRGILALPGTATRPDILLRAAGRIMGAVVSHNSAATIHGLEPLPKGLPSVTVPHRGTYSFPGLRVHQSTDLRPEHTLRKNGMQLTNPERTVIDLAKVLRRRQLERLLDNALAAGTADFDRLVELFLSLTRQGKTGLAALGELLGERAKHDLIDATVLERELFELISAASLPLPVREFHAPWLEAINGRVDFAYLGERIVIEADSRRWHLLMRAFEVDKRRDNEAQIHGWMVLRITWRMIIDEPDYVIGTLSSALSIRSPDFSR